MRPKSLRGSSITGDIAFDGKSYVQEETKQATGNIEGYADKHNGEIFINIPGLAEFKVSGLPTIDSIGRGKQGDSGVSGRSGNNGKIQPQGVKGQLGKQGARGEQGRDGNDGYRGYKGDDGQQGDIGEKGEQGGAGQIPYFIQSEDPGNIGAGGVWIKRMDIIEREDVNVYAPRLKVTDITIYRKETRNHIIPVITDGIPLERVNFSTEDDDIISLEYVIRADGSLSLTVVNIEVPEGDDVWETEVELFVENSAGSTTETFAVTVLAEERNDNES